MPLKRANEQTPCGALFDILKRFGGISHKELASMILSERPLADGRSPQSRSSDRSWVSRFVVHAPADASQERLFRDYGVAAQMILSERPLADGRSPQSRSSDRSWVSRFVVHAPADASQERLFRDYGVAAQRVMNRLRTSRSGQSRSSDRSWVSRFVVHAPADASQERLFRDYGVAAQRVMNRLRTSRSGSRTCAEFLDMVCGEAGEPMVRALEASHDDVRLYRNALARVRDGEGYTVGERAEAALVLLVAAGCSANVGRAVDYTTEYIRCLMGGRLGTPTSCPVSLDPKKTQVDLVLPRVLGSHDDVRLYRNALARVRDGEGYTVGERAEAALVLLVAAGCSANGGRAVDYTTEYIRCLMGGRLGTPTSCPVSLDPKKTQVDLVLPRVLGFVRIVDGVIASEPYWVSSGSAGAEIGALATGAEDITDVAGDVSAHHARVWYEAADAPVRPGPRSAHWPRVRRISPTWLETFRPIMRACGTRPPMPVRDAGC